jgi:hypothetical protein
LTVSDPEGPESAKQYIFALQAYCKEHPQMLLILDNVIDPELLSTDQPLLSAGISLLTLGCGLLFTTRKSFQIPGVARQAVGVLAPEASSALMNMKRTPKNAAEEEKILEICETLGHLPLAIVLAARYLQNYSSVSVEDYQLELAARRLETIDIDAIPESELATRHAASVSATLRSQWEALADDVAKRLLRLAAEFQEAEIIPLARLGLLYGPLACQSAIDRPLERACRLLWAVSLMEPVGNGQLTRVHPLIRQFVANLFDPGERERFRMEASANVAAAFDDPLRLAAEFKSRGIDAILADMHIAASWAPPGQPGLQRLERLVDRERNHLASEFLVQLQHRAVSMGARQIADRAAQARERDRAAWIKTEAMSEEEDVAWIRALQGHAWGVTALTVHSDGRRCVSGSKDKNVVLWDLERSQIVRRLAEPDSEVPA